MADEIYLKTGELSSALLRKAIRKAENAQKNAGAAGDEAHWGHNWAWGGNTYQLFSTNAESLIWSADSKLEDVLGKLEKLAAILESGPEAMEEIDRKYKSDLKGWRKSGNHGEILWIAGGGATAGATAVEIKKRGNSSKVIVNENPDYRHQWHGDNIVPPKENKKGNRSPEAYREVMDALDVENNVRYQEAYNPYWGFSSTCCNVYVWDVLTAMDCQIPSTEYFGCGAMRDWMASSAGAEAGWVEVDQATAIAMANKGCPTVAADTVGAHVAMVAPQHDGDTGVYLSQAGWKNFNYDTQAMGWDSSYSIRYFYHV